LKKLYDTENSFTMNANIPAAPHGYLKLFLMIAPDCFVDGFKTFKAEKKKIVLQVLKKMFKNTKHLNALAQKPVIVDEYGNIFEPK
ncbi:MAG TPA: hypothetical protein VLB02_02130, partial [Candidatus Paceibacterota bacterium]|nr:hypothetical protein [Candidatus Paceibacterota bacterium]